MLKHIYQKYFWGPIKCFHMAPDLTRLDQMIFQILEMLIFCERTDLGRSVCQIESPVRWQIFDKSVTSPSSQPHVTQVHSCCSFSHKYKPVVAFQHFCDELCLKSLHDALVQPSPSPLHRISSSWRRSLWLWPAWRRLQHQRHNIIGTKHHHHHGIASHHHGPGRGLDLHHHDGQQRRQQWDHPEPGRRSHRQGRLKLERTRLTDSKIKIDIQLFLFRLQPSPLTSCPASWALTIRLAISLSSSLSLSSRIYTALWISSLILTLSSPNFQYYEVEKFSYSEIVIMFNGTSTSGGYGAQIS